jgi:hypothetical protein
VSHAHALMEFGKTPGAVYEKKCERCSLIDSCMPGVVRGRSVGEYLDNQVGPVSSG